VTLEEEADTFSRNVDNKIPTVATEEEQGPGIERGHISFKYLAYFAWVKIQGGSNMTGTNCDLFTHK
jgi:hypothetical protein